MIEDTVILDIGVLPLSVYKHVMAYMIANTIPWRALEESFLGNSWPSIISVSAADATLLKLKFGL